MDTQERKDQETLLKIAAWAIDHTCNSSGQIHNDLPLVDVFAVIFSLRGKLKTQSQIHQSTIDDCETWLRCYDSFVKENKSK